MASAFSEGGRPRRGEGPWVSISAAARALGVSTSTLRVWASEGRIPHVRTAGGHRRFNPEGLRDWLANQPGNATPLPRRAAFRLEPAPTLAHSIRGAAETVLGTIEQHLEGQPLSEFRRLAENERRATVLAWLDTLADAFAAGTLSVALEQASNYGRAHGLAGSSAELALTGSLALERALEDALARAGANERQCQQVTAAMATLSLRVAVSWAEAAADAVRL